MHQQEHALSRETVQGDDPTINTVSVLYRIHTCTLSTPTLRYPPVASRCNEKKREVMVKLEGKIESGIEKLVQLPHFQSPVPSYFHSIGV